MTTKSRNTRVAIATICLLGAIGLVVSRYMTRAVTSPAASDLPATNVVKEIDGYRNWTKVNPAPQLMARRVSNACNIDLNDTSIHIDSAANPHRDKYFTVFVNDLGREAMLNQKNPKFPKGSVIVKEKLASKESQAPELLTVMIKQANGFNPASGDWEYMVVDGSGTKVEGRGKLENCQACHVTKSVSDYVFRTYLPR